MKILGISAFYHDSAACLVDNGDIVAAAQEERFTRKKHDASFPSRAIEYCLNSQGIAISDIDYIIFYEKPFLKFERLLETYLSSAPLGIVSFLSAMPVWIRQKLWLKETIKKNTGFAGKILFSSHHESHAASAFFPSPFKEAAILVIDAVGEKTTTSWGVGKGNSIEITEEINFPHSLGMLYSALTYFTGFKVNSGEYKLMGLAPFGKPIYKDIILSKLIDVKEDGSFKLNMDYFGYGAGLTMTNKKFERLFGGPARKPESPITQREMDLAMSIQKVTEEIILAISRHIHHVTGQENLCLAGGVALNCVVNGKLLKEGPFKHIWIQPAAGDSGGALGAALVVWYMYLANQRVAGGKDAQHGSLLGPAFSNDQIRKYLNEHGIPFDELPSQNIPETIADLINAQYVIGLFQGRMEFGPRALGNRSIIGDARSPKMQKIMNVKIKFRESFRPFAPSVLYEKVSEYFELNQESPYMLLTAAVREDKRITYRGKEKDYEYLQKTTVPHSSIPAVTHVDYSARIQTVKREDNPFYYGLIDAFDKKYDCPVIINTSFNVRGEPIVCSPEDAYRCFMRTNMDYLLMGNCLLAKQSQPAPMQDKSWTKEFVLD